MEWASLVSQTIFTLSNLRQTNAMPTLFWYLVYMHCQNRQDEFVEEVKRCVGQSKLVELNLDNVLTSDLLHAGLKETLRIQGHNISPRSLEEDTVLRIKGKEYLLKKGSLAFAPSSLLNWNPDIYANPEMWKVERFLENNNDNIGMKYDVKKLKIPLLIWGAGTHTVITEVNDIDCAVPRSKVCGKRDDNDVGDDFVVLRIGSSGRTRIILPTSSASERSVRDGGQRTRQTLQSSHESTQGVSQSGIIILPNRIYTLIQ